MTRITGQRGRLTLNNSYIEFGNWDICENEKRVVYDYPGLKDWSGNFEIQDSDQGKVFALSTSDQQINADFYEGSLKYNGEIIITNRTIPGNIVHFTGTGELNKSS